MATIDIPTIASGVPLYDFALLCEKISSTKGKDSKKSLLKSFISHWRSSHRRLHGSQKTPDSFFLAMRMLLPSLDNERLSYGMKETFLAKYYIDALGISKDSKDAKLMLNFRAPMSAKQDAGDFASVAYSVLKNRCPEKGTMTLFDLDKALDAIAQANAEKERHTIKTILQKIIRNSSALEQKWILRIILKEMKIGINENSILPTFHPDALELYNVCNSLLKVCLDLHDENTKLNEAELILGTPFRPMLGQRVNMVEVEKMMGNSEFFIETKIDGERMQLHKDGEEFHYFSRNSIEYTKQFGASRHRGTLTPYIADHFKSNLQSCILDGEMVGYDEESNGFVLKAANIDVKSDYIGDNIHPCFVVFDVLMINEEKLANVPLHERIKKMGRVFDTCESRIQVVERKIGRSMDDVVTAINYAIDHREEGIVIKVPQSTYKPSKRKGSGWLKLKPEYLEGVGDDLDLLVIGGSYGSGHRRGLISHFLLGVSMTSDDSSEKPTKFMTFGRVGSGYTAKELREVSKKLDPHWKLFDQNKPPKNILFSDGFKEKPDVWIEPENSIIVQIKAAEITVSGKYKAGCTLRFPRLEKFRDDKPWYDCMSATELEDLRNMADGKISYKLTDGNESSPSKKRRVVARVERARTIADHLKSADLTDVKEISQLFTGKEFCIINGPSDFSKHDIEKKVVELGGLIVQNPTVNTMCIIAEKENFRVKTIKKTGNHDVVHASWIINCFQKKSLIPYTIDKMLYTTEKTNSLLHESFDKYGDSFTEDTDENKLVCVFSNIKETIDLMKPNHITNLKRKYFDNSQYKYSLFQNLKMYVCPSSTKSNDLEFVTLEFKLHGGKVMTDLVEDETTHVLIDSNCTDSEVEDTIQSWLIKPAVVLSNWIVESIEVGELLGTGCCSGFFL